MTIRMNTRDWFNPRCFVLPFLRLLCWHSAKQWLIFRTGKSVCHWPILSKLRRPYSRCCWWEFGWISARRRQLWLRCFPFVPALFYAQWLSLRYVARYTYITDCFFSDLVLSLMFPVWAYWISGCHCIYVQRSIAERAVQTVNQGALAHWSGHSAFAHFNMCYMFFDPDHFGNWISNSDIELEWELELIFRIASCDWPWHVRFDGVPFFIQYQQYYRAFCHKRGQSPCNSLVFEDKFSTLVCSVFVCFLR